MKHSVIWSLKRAAENSNMVQVKKNIVTVMDLHRHLLEGVHGGLETTNMNG